MKIYRNLTDAVAHTLQEIFNNRKYADKAIESAFKKNSKWGSRDRRFIASAVYDIVRNYRLYADTVQSEKNYWLMTALWMHLNGYDVPDWQEFRDFNHATAVRRLEKLQSTPEIALSYPQWLWNLAKSELGEEVWQREARALHDQAPVYLRANTLKTTAIALREALTGDGIRCEVVHHDALVLHERTNIFSHRLFKEGHFEVQDLGSQAIAPFLNPNPGSTVIDACAGAGGKTLHLAALMENKGRIIALDTDSRKLEELKKRARRAGAHNIETRTVESAKTIQALSDRADFLLLDVPCSGLGVLKRNPDTKWKLTEDVLQRTRALQRDILFNYSAMLKNGGTMVYATCSLLPSENVLQLNPFLEVHPDLNLVDEKNLMPTGGTDGFYMARMEKIPV